MTPSFIDASLVRFVLVGISNTIVGLSVTYVSWRFLGFGHWWANAAGYLVGFLWSFTFNRLWSFDARDAGHPAAQFWRFTLVCAVSYGVNVIVLSLVRQAMGDDSFVPFLVAMVAYSIVNYLGSRLFVFARPAP